MKPTFALSLSFEGISLLHRCAGGWRNAGEVALDAPDLAMALSGLRGAASRLDAGPLLTKLIIPNEQIRYITIDTPAVDEAGRDQLVRAALEGATPYAVDELAYDISVEGESTHIAAVARETLAEAEAFAVEHAFGPVSFAAIPGRKPFLGEPFFGPTSFARSTLPPGEQVDPDGVAVVVVGPAQFPVDGVRPVAPEPVAQDLVPVAAPEPAPAPQPEPQPEQQPEQQPDPQPEPAVATFASRRRRGSDAEPAPTPAAPPEPPMEAPVAEPEPAPVAEAPAAPVAPPVAAPEPAAAPPLVAVQQPAAPTPSLAAPQRMAMPPVEEDPKPAAPSRLAGLLKRKPRAEPVAPQTAAPIPEPVAPPAPRRDVDVSGMPPKLAAAVLKTADPDAGAEAPPARQRMTVFDKQAAAAAPARSRPRFLGLILTAVLLLFLAGVVAWASIFLDDEFVGFFGRDDATTETASGPGPAPARNAPSTAGLAAAPASVSFDLPNMPAPDAGSDQALTTPIGAEQPVALALLDPTSGGLTDTDAAVLDALRAPRTPAGIQKPQPGTQTTATRYAVTGIWSEAPPEPDTPSAIGLDDLYIGSIDNHDLSQDAVALPALASLRADDSIGFLSSPTAPDTQFDFDERGLVRATPEGALTPDGILVYLGRPDIVPPPTPERAVVAPEPEDTIRDRLAGFRPKARPEGFTEQNERGQFGGLTRSELAAVRPRPRPETLKAPEKVEEEDAVEDTATAQAVAGSVRPKDRPKNFAALVKKQQANPANATVASIAPRTVLPKIPTKTSVSQQATLNNAIDLRQVNLIGVYGTPSNRRALVRMPSGRYKKVQVGDSIDGGHVSAIGDSELRYRKGGRNMVLRIPSG